MLGWELPPHNSGGLGVACFNMAKALAKQGADIDFVVPYHAEHKDTNFMHVLNATELDPIHRYGNGAYTSFQLFDETIPNLKDENLISMREVQKEYCEYIEKYLMTEEKPDIIHAHDWLTYEAGIMAKKEYNIPLIAHVHATEFDRAGMHTGNPLIHEVEYEGLIQADRIVAVSETTKRIIHEKYRIPLSKIDVIYNSLDEKYDDGEYIFDDKAYQYLKSLKEQGNTIISTVGRFTVQKGLFGLMSSAALAISKNPNLTFIFAGDGEERNDLIELSANLGISKNVIFTGFIRGQKLRDIYSLTDIFVMSSISEPFGLTALEAAHHGNALILTHQSGVSEILWSALKYDFWDKNKLANEILAIANNPALKNTLKKNIQTEYHRISWDDIAKNCLKVYNKSMNHKRNQ